MTHTPPGSSERSPVAAGGQAARSVISSLGLALAAVVIAAALALAVPALAWAFPGNVAWAIGAALVAAGITLVVALVRTRALDRTLRLAHQWNQELRASEAKFAGILDIADDAIISVDERQRIVHFNKGAEKMFGFTENEVVGQPLEMLIPPRFRRAHGAHLAAFGGGRETARRMGERSEIFGLRRGDQEFPAEASISKLDAAGGRLYTVVMRDITERKRSETAQRLLATLSEQLARSIEFAATAEMVANVPVPGFADACLLDVVEADGTIRRRTSDPSTIERGAALQAIAAAGTLSPDSPARVIDVLRTGRSDVTSVVTDDWIEGHTDLPHAWRELGVRSQLIVPLVAHGQTMGTMTFLATTAQRRPYSAADLWLAEEIAHRCALALENARLYESARSATRARDEVLGVVSHDLRNPLSAIGMFARALREPDAEQAVRTEIADSITQATQWMQRLIQDLLDVSAIEAGRLSVERQPESLSAIAAAAVALVGADARERRLRLEVQVPEELPRVDADAERIVQVLANLLGNAVKFTEPGGTITVRATEGPAGMQVAVSDTGVGIPEAELPNVFTRYWHARRQSSRRGTGLGLAVARGIVEAHGGRIWAESAVGTGSTFYFTLPIAPPSFAATTSPAAAKLDQPTESRPVAG